MKRRSLLGVLVAGGLAGSSGAYLGRRMLRRLASSDPANATLGPAPSPIPGPVPTAILTDASVLRPPGWLDGWLAAQATGFAPPQWLSIIGDSIAEGGSSDDYFGTAWAAILRARLAEQYSISGDYFSVTLSRDYSVETGGFGFGQQNSPLSIASDNRTWQRPGNGPYPAYSAAAASAIRFVAPSPCTSIEVWHTAPMLGTFDVQVDSQLAQTIRITRDQVDQPQRIALGPFGAAGHTLTAGNQSAAGVMAIQGIASTGYAPLGVGVARAAYGGASAQAYASAPPGVSVLLKPALAIVSLGVNDAQNGVTPVDFGRYLATILASLRTARQDCSILLVACCNPIAGMVRTFTNAAAWPGYVAVMRAVAESERCGFVDFQSLWGETALQQGLVAPDNPHPSPRGHAAMANAIGTLVLSRTP